jgi:2-dehydro-3-deoxy-D-gluconate 5-dehydrogenase
MEVGMNSKECIDELFSLEGHTGIVTGASRGIGLGIAKVLTGAGAKVYNLSRGNCTEEKMINGEMINMQVDLTDHEAVGKVIKEIALKEGHLDFLVNNAGMTFKAPVQNFPREHYDRVLSLNLDAVFELSRQVYPYLKKSGFIGRIVNISSMAAHLGFDGVVPYCMSKSGIEGLTRGLAEEWKNDNILVNSVSPGWVLTKLNEDMFANNPERKAAALNKITLNRFGNTAEIGYMVLFLLGGASEYLTGQDFAVDGGALSHGF